VPTQLKEKVFSFSLHTYEGPETANNAETVLFQFFGHYNILCKFTKREK